jgi:ATP-dependent Clp protease ATP-binding subunit ClpB
VVPQILSKLNIAVSALASGSGVQLSMSPRLRTVLLRAHDELSQFGDQYPTHVP